jgi:CRISPR system Cascade subunit CasB
MTAKGVSMEAKKKAGGRGSAFIDAIVPRLQKDSGFAAALKRADNPATEHQAWEHLLNYGCDIEKPWERLAYATAAAAAARAKIDRDGMLDIGKSLARCYEDGNASDSARSKLRRLLACADAEEACLIARPILSFIGSKGEPSSYGRLLDDLLYFGEKVKLSWASSFYRGEVGER